MFLLRAGAVLDFPHSHSLMLLVLFKQCFLHAFYTSPAYSGVQAFPNSLCLGRFLSTNLTTSDLAGRALSFLKLLHPEPQSNNNGKGAAYKKNGSWYWTFHVLLETVGVVLVFPHCLITDAFCCLSGVPLAGIVRMSICSVLARFANASWREDYLSHIFGSMSKCNSGTSIVQAPTDFSAVPI